MSGVLRLKTNEELLAEIAALPEHQTGEVIDGTLYVMGRPHQRHQEVESEIKRQLRNGGPGGRDSDWVIYVEVSVRFLTNEEVVPDVAGWRRAKFANHFDENPIHLAPDWVCEILSDSTRRKDLGPKRRLYAQQGVSHLWLVSPEAHVLEAFMRTENTWQLVGTWSEDDVVTGLAPFPEVSFTLSDWWL